MVDGIDGCFMIAVIILSFMSSKFFFTFMHIHFLLVCNILSELKIMQVYLCQLIIIIMNLVLHKLYIPTNHLLM